MTDNGLNSAYNSVVARKLNPSQHLSGNRAAYYDGVISALIPPNFTFSSKE